jgi:uncharacterized protein YbjT (DUF2867 family)
MTRILVTGATGTTGQPIFNTLSLRTDVEVKGASRHPYSPSPLVHFDYHDRSSIQAALDGIDKVFLVTPFTTHMLEMESRVIEEISRSGSVRQVVKLSIAGADAAQPTALAKLHRQLEQALEQTGKAITVLRAQSYMQNYTRFMGGTIKAHSAFYLPIGVGCVSVVDVRDVADAAVKVLTEEGHEGKAYTLTGPQALSNYEMAHILSAVLARRINYVVVSEQQTLAGMKVAGTPEWIREAMLELYRYQKQGQASFLTNHIEWITGHPPRSFEQFVQDHKEAFAKEAADFKMTG